MDNSARSTGELRDTPLGAAPPKRQVARAWLLMLAGFAVFLALLSYTGVAAYSYVRDTTESHTATVEPVSGQSLLIRSDNEQDWRLVTERTTVREGDRISTGAETAAWITMFDQGTIEVSENSLVRIDRMRTSRLFRKQKEIEITPIRGSIYLGMAPRGDYSSSVLRVASGPVSVEMRDDLRVDQTGSFLVETQRLDPSGDESSPILSVRVAVLRGQATVQTDRDSQALGADQQVVVDPGGEHGDVTSARRELIRNGDFSRQFADWVEYHDQSGDAGGDSGVIERVPVEQDDTSGVALQIARSSSSGANWETGVQQTINQSLRVHSSLNLSFDARIDEQQLRGGGDDLTEFPLLVQLNYVDLQGQDQQWRRGFYIFDDLTNPVPEDIGTRIDPGEWTPVSLDLRNLSPLPRQISSIVVYSSGRSYRTQVTNISLTSSETGDDEYD